MSSFLNHLSPLRPFKGPLANLKDRALCQTPNKSANRGRCSSLVQHPGMTIDWSDIGPVTIDVLPDDVLIDIFDFYLVQLEDPLSPSLDWLERTKAWQKLVHVCRRWRDVVFQSPRRLDLHILCTARTPMTVLTEMLDTWPVLPLAIRVCPRCHTKNTIAVLTNHRDRICRISVVFDFTSVWPSGILTILHLIMMQQFPALTLLRIIYHSSNDLTPIPDSFLDGSAPHLRYLHLNAIPYPGLPKLLLSATNLVALHLSDIPQYGYILPAMMATCLLTLIRLERLTLGFQFFQPPGFHFDREGRHPPTSKHAIFPTLARFEFKGESEYLEDFLARIDAAPQLDCLEIGFFNQPSGIFHTSHLSQFINSVPRLQTLIEARVIAFGSQIWVTVPSSTPTLGHKVLGMEIIILNSRSQSSSLQQLCTSSLPLFPILEHLYLRPPIFWQNEKWLDVLHPFTAVKNLYISRKSALRIVPALQWLVRDGVTKVLPALQNLFLEELRPIEPVQLAINQFVHARRLSGNPIAVSKWVVGENLWWDINEE